MPQRELFRGCCRFVVTNIKNNRHLSLFSLLEGMLSRVVGFACFCRWMEGELKASSEAPCDAMEPSIVDSRSSVSIFGADTDHL
jgi:hypothetical protein